MNGPPKRERGPGQGLMLKDFSNSNRNIPHAHAVDQAPAHPHRQRHPSRPSRTTLRVARAWLAPNGGRP